MPSFRINSRADDGTDRFRSLVTLVASLAKGRLVFTLRSLLARAALMLDPIELL
jgi:hypothetical protein